MMVTDRVLIRNAWLSLRALTGAGKDGSVKFSDIMQVMITLRERLEEPEQEPVAWRYWTENANGGFWTYSLTKPDGRKRKQIQQPLYVSPTSSQWEKERQLDWQKQQTEHWKQHCHDLMKKLQEKENV